MRGLQNIVSVLNTSEVHLKMVTMVNFILGMFYHNNFLSIWKKFCTIPADFLWVQYYVKIKSYGNKKEPSEPASLGWCHHNRWCVFSLRRACSPKGLIPNLPIKGPAVWNLPPKESCSCFSMIFLSTQLSVFLTWGFSPTQDFLSARGWLQITNGLRPGRLRVAWQYPLFVQLIDYAPQFYGDIEELIALVQVL